MQRKTTLLACAVGVACGAFWAATAESAPRIHFQENFRNYADTAPGVSGKGMTVGNDPSWAGAAELNVRAEQDGFVYDRFIAAPGLSRFDFLFHFRFMNAAAPKDGTPAVAGAFGRGANGSAG